jgi:Tetratricopeptide repeat
VRGDGYRDVSTTRGQEVPGRAFRRCDARHKCTGEGRLSPYPAGVVLWTPLLIFCDSRGRVLRQSRGYLDPVHFIAEGKLALAAIAIFNRQLDQATATLNGLIESEATAPELRAEALYWAGVAAYRSAGDKAVMVPIYEELVRRHPDSPWAAKVWPYVGWEHGRAKLESA